MSETVHYKGKLTPTAKTLAEFDPDADDIYDHYETAVEIDGLIYTVEKEYIETYEDMFTSSKNENGTIDFEIKYYNGGCGFGEAIDEALGNSINNNELSELKAQNERLKSDVQFFVDRVESGTARSVTTYARFKETLKQINK